MKLAVNVGYWGRGAGTDLSFILEAERLGYSSVWVAESWGSDAVTVLSYQANPLFLVDGKAHSVKEDLITKTFSQFFNAYHQ